MKTGLLCLGLTTLDIIALGIDALPQNEGTTLIPQIAVAPAGTAAGAALVAARLGVKTRLAGAVGDDLMGRMVRLGLEEQGVDTALLQTSPQFPTSATVLAIDFHGRRPNFHALGAGVFASVTPQVTQAATAARFVHYAGVGGPLLDGGVGAGLVQAAHEAGAVVSCDLIAPGPSALDELKRILPHVDYFMPSAAEAFTLSGTEDLAAAASLFLDLGARACVLKNGSHGVYVALEGERLELPAHAITPVDTSSCGDSFCAGLIAGLDHGLAPLEACRFAVTVSAQVAQGLGTLGKLQDFDHTRAAMAAMPLRTS